MSKNNQTFKIMSKNNQTFKITAIVTSVVVMIIAFIGINEYKEFKSDYKSYIHSLHKLNESYILGNDIDIYSDDYTNVIEIEEKYQGRMFNSAFKKIQEDNAEFVGEIEKKRQEEIRNNNIVKNQRSEIENNRTEVERSEHERLEKERSEAARLEKERLERERKEKERIELENSEAARLEKERLERERKEHERFELEKSEAERLEKERLKRERLEQERREIDRLLEERRTKKEVNIANEKVTKGTISDHDYVDLGLSVKWATCNVGANSPHEYGDYFAWSEVETKNYYSKNNYIETDTIYNDVASREWGKTWRTPTYSECMELVNKCRWEWTTENGVKGYKVTGLIGTSIFLPAPGDYDGEIKYHEGNDGYYWSSTPHETISNHAYGISFKRTRHRVTSYSKYLGKSVRPVTK